MLQAEATESSVCQTRIQGANSSPLSFPSSLFSNQLRSVSSGRRARENLNLEADGKMPVLLCSTVWLWYKWYKWCLLWNEDARHFNKSC